MKVSSVKCEVIKAGSISLTKLLDDSLPSLNDGDVVVITSKVVSLCENNVVAKDSIDKEALVIRESQLYLPATLSKYGHHFTITDNTLIPLAGIDESNGDDLYVLWPKNPQATANSLREHLLDKYGLNEIGVIITDSTCTPLRRGTIGIALAHSGFSGLHDYVGKPDLFGRPFAVSVSNIAGGLAAAAVVAMGEGAEQTPLCVISDASFVNFVNENPSAEELAEIYIPIEEDLFAPFLQSVAWKKGDRNIK